MLDIEDLFLIIIIILICYLICSRKENYKPCSDLGEDRCKERNDCKIAYARGMGGGSRKTCVRKN